MRKQKITSTCECGHPISFSSGKWRHSTNRYMNYGREKPIFHGFYGTCKCKKARLMRRLRRMTELLVYKDAQGEWYNKKQVDKRIAELEEIVAMQKIHIEQLEGKRKVLSEAEFEKALKEGES